MKVKIFAINEGTDTQKFFLGGFDNEDSCRPLHYAPYWKTRKGAMKWAEKHGYKVVEG